MNKKLVITLITGLLLATLANAQEGSGFALSFNGKGGEYHNVGAGRWSAPAAPEDVTGGGYTVTYYSGTFLASVDLSRNRIKNVHFNPHFHLTAAYRSEGGFRTMLRIYPVAGVCFLADKDSKFDYGAALALCAGGRVGGSLFGRVTRHTFAYGISIAF